MAPEMLKNEFPDGTLNVPYEPDVLPSFANHKIRRMMIENWVNNDQSLKGVDKLCNSIKSYCAEKDVPVRNVTFNEVETGTNNRLMVIQVFMEGTTYYKHITQKHVDEYILELKQLQDNTTV